MTLASKVVLICSSLVILLGCLVVVLAVASALTLGLIALIGGAQAVLLLAAVVAWMLD